MNKLDAQSELDGLKKIKKDILGNKDWESDISQTNNVNNKIDFISDNILTITGQKCKLLSSDVESLKIASPSNDTNLSNAAVEIQQQINYLKKTFDLD